MSDNRKPQSHSQCNKNHYIGQPQVISLTVNKNIHLYKNVYPFIFLQRETLKNVTVKKGKGRDS